MVAPSSTVGSHIMTVNRLVCAVSAALVRGGCQSIPSPAPASKTALGPEQETYFPPDAELRELLQALVERGESKGIVLGLLEPDGRRRVIAYGDAGAGAPPLSSKTAFEIGSITKTFVNTILADMVRRGDVSLDDPVAKFLPAGVTVPSRNGRQITLLDLATHTSGLPRSLTGFGYEPPDRSNPYADYQAEHLYAFLSSYELERAVGAEFVYSNVGAGLLGHALARAAGAETVGELIRQRITGPLGMEMTDFGRAGELGAWSAKGHNRKGEVVPYWDFAVLSGAGALNSNADDMLTYIEANVGEPGSPIEVAMRDAHQPRRSLKTKGSSVGLGWQQRSGGGRTIIHHGGGTGGFQSYLGFDPVTQAGVVILGNSRGFEARDDVVFQLLRAGRPEFRKASIPLSEIEPLLGLYEFEGGNRRFFTRDGKLFTRSSGGQDMEVFPAGNDRFFYGPGTLSWFEVKRDPAGKHVLSMYQGGSEDAVTSVRTAPVPAD